MQMLADADAAFEYGAALAGVTCKAANCYTERIVMPDGTITTLTKRDSRPGTRPLGNGSVFKRRHEVDSQTPATFPDASSQRVQHKGAAFARARLQAHEDALESSFMQTWLARRGAVPPVRAQGVATAAERMSAIRSRVSERAMANSELDKSFYDA